MLIGDGELYRLFFRWRSSEAKLTRRQRIRLLTRLNRLTEANPICAGPGVTQRGPRTSTHLPVETILAAESAGASATRSCGHRRRGPRIRSPRSPGKFSPASEIEIRSLPPPRIDVEHVSVIGQCRAGCRSDGAMTVAVIAIIFAFLGSCFKKLCASVNCLTLGRRQICELWRRGEANARMDGGNGRCGRDWPNLVVRGDVQVGACAERGTEVGGDIGMSSFALCRRHDGG
jgi:hypothetical protein